MRGILLAPLSGSQNILITRAISHSHSLQTDQTAAVPDYDSKAPSHRRDRYREMGHGTSKSGVPEPPDANNGSSSSRSSRFRRRFRWNRRGNGSDSNPQLKTISAEDFSGIARIQLNHVRSNPPSPDLSKNPVL